MNLTNIVDTAVFADFDLLEQLIDFLIGKPLSKVCQNYDVDEYPISYQKTINKVSYHNEALLQRYSHLLPCQTLGILG